MAERGYTVTAMDIAETAVKKACLKAREQGMDITFQQNDILDNRLKQTFDAVFDRGCYHIFALEKRELYVPEVAGLLRSGWFLFLKCFSTREKRSEGPYRISPEEINELFSPLFEVLSVEHTVFQSLNLDPEPKALFCVMKKR
jgi:cyclopropane fatty-acyl-phospholipid synthase-like methyltransferase